MTEENTAEIPDDDQVLDFYLSQRGDLIVKRPDDLNFSEFFLNYGQHPSFCSGTFVGACVMLDTVEPGVVSAMLEGDPSDPVARGIVDSFKTTVHAADEHEQGRLLAAVDLMSSTFEVAKTNFLCGIRYAIAHRDGVVVSINTDELNVHESSAEGVDLTPAVPGVGPAGELH